MVLCSHSCQWDALMFLHGILGPSTLFFCSCEFFCTWRGLSHPDLPWIDAFRFWPTVGRNRMPSRWHWSAGKKNPEWCRMSVPSLNSVHVLCGFTFSYPAMNFWFCVVTAVSEMLWCFCTASWDAAHCSFAAVSSSAHDEASVTQTCRESMRFDFDPPWEEIECQADDIGALAKKSGVMPHVSA